MARLHDMEEVVEQLDALMGVTVTKERELIIPRGTTTLGNKSWGKVDYLVNHCSYRLVR